MIDGVMESPVIMEVTTRVKIDTTQVWLQDYSQVYGLKKIKLF